MTDLNTVISPVNIAIGIHKGWHHPKQEDNQDLTEEQLERVWCTPDGEWCWNPHIEMDFEHDARLYMALFEEMCNENDLRLGYQRGNFRWFVKDLRDDYVFSDDLGNAICQAYVKLKGIEVVG